MILQTGFSAQVRTIASLAGSVDWLLTKKCTSLSELAYLYRRFLHGMDQRKIKCERELPKIVSDYREAVELSALFSNDSLLDDKAQADVISFTVDEFAEQKTEILQKGLIALSEFVPEHAALLNSIITDIFIMPSHTARGGSTSQAIGVIWMNPKPSYSLNDTLEMLVHELAHHTMFLDELRYGHYSYQNIMDRSTWARSAILGTLRPLDKVLHSVVVSAEIILMRNLNLGNSFKPKVHPPTPLMVEQFWVSAYSATQAANDFPGVLTERGMEILALAQRCVKEKCGC